MKSNTNYILYKKVFGNIVLSKIIFKYCIRINKQITSGYSSASPFHKTCSYEDSTFNWVITYKQYELLKFKIKSNYEFKENEFTSSDNLELFITHFNSNKDNDGDDGNEDILSLFYYTNKKNLNKLSKTSGSKIDLLDISIKSQSFYFFKMVIQSNSIKPDLNNILKFALSIGN